MLHIEDQSQTLRIIDSANKLIKADIAGGNSSTLLTKLVSELYNYIGKIYSNTHHNHILFDTYYSNATLMLNKSLEIFLELSSIKNPRSIKIEKLNSIYIELIINHINYSEFEKILLNYKNKALILKDDRSKNLLHTTCLTFLKNIKEHQTKEIGIYKKDESSWAGINRRINVVGQNIAIIYTVLNFTENQYKQVFTIFIQLFKNNGVFYPQTFGVITELFHERQKKLSITQFDKIKNLYKKFPNYFDKFNFSELEADPKFNEDDDIDVLSDFLIKRKELACDTKFKELFEKNLDKHFSFYHYRIGVLCDAISFSKYEEQAIKYLINAFEEEKRYKDPFWSSYESKLADFIEMLYYKNKKAKQYKYKTLIPDDNEYIKWLIDLKSYPKEKFEPYWVLLNNSNIFYKEFAKHQYVKIAIEDYLKKNEQSRLSQIYFLYFI